MSKAETDVQFFSHLNGISLDNKWGEMINLLDTCLVNGLTLPNISDATIADDGRMTINFKSAHNCLLFQCVTLLGFSPSTFNDKYRIVGVPSTTQLLLSTDLTAQTATTVGTAMLSPLGYEIVFSANTKRVYRALNPTAQHPFIRVDESRASADGASVYDDSYAKYAMVGLIENMTHIDDYEDPNKLQLPLDTSDLTKNWKISGTGSSVVRGWARWIWSKQANMGNSSASSSDSEGGVPGSVNFTLIGDVDSFYLIYPFFNKKQDWKIVQGCGLFLSALPTDIIPNWFLMAKLHVFDANTPYNTQNNNPDGFTPMMNNDMASYFHVSKYVVNNKISNNSKAYAIQPDYNSGYTGQYSASHLPALEIPFSDDAGYLRGTLKHICYAGKKIGSYQATTPLISDSSIYVGTNATSGNGYDYIGGFYFYLGEMS